MKYKGHKALLLLLILAAVFCLLPGMGVTAHAANHVHGGEAFSEWTSTTSMPTEPGNYFLANDVTLPSTWTIPAGEEFSICLNGHTLKTSSGAVFSVPYANTILEYLR